MSVAPGLCSITLRALSADEVVRVGVRAGIEGIEWGADGHAPPGGGTPLEQLGRRCRDAGIEVVSYGSYLGFGPAADEDPKMVDAVLESAEALGAPMVRIWTELGVGPAAADAERRRVVARATEHAVAIASRGMTPALEFHPLTLTETAASANVLLDAIDEDTVRTHWQPDPSLPVEDALGELALVAPRLAHLHVFSWGSGGIAERLPLEEGAELWPPALSVVDRDAEPLAGRRFALCEYVRADDPEQLVADVATLRRWLDARG